MNICLREGGGRGRDRGRDFDFARDRECDEVEADIVSLILDAPSNNELPLRSLLMEDKIESLSLMESAKMKVIVSKTLFHN